MLESRSFCLKIHNLDLMSNNNGLFLFAQCDLLSIFSLMNQELFFYVQNFCAVRNESVWPWFNLSISYGYTSNVSRTVLECLGFNIETAKASLPGLQLFTTTCGKFYVYLSSF